MFIISTVFWLMLIMFIAIITPFLLYLAIWVIVIVPIYVAVMCIRVFYEIMVAFGGWLRGRH